MRSKKINSKEKYMAEVIGIRFKDGGKVYYFDPCGIAVKADDAVIVETARGLECGEVTIANRVLDDEEITAPLKPVLRTANETDLKTVAEKSRTTVLFGEYPKVTFFMVNSLMRYLLL